MFVSHHLINGSEKHSKEQKWWLFWQVCLKAYFLFEVPTEANSKQQMFTRPVGSFVVNLAWQDGLQLWWNFFTATNCHSFYRRPSINRGGVQGGWKQDTFSKMFRINSWSCCLKCSFWFWSLLSNCLKLVLTYKAVLFGRQFRIDPRSFSVDQVCHATPFLHWSSLPSFSVVCAVAAGCSRTGSIFYNVTNLGHDVPVLAASAHLTLITIVWRENASACCFCKLWDSTSDSNIILQLQCICASGNLSQASQWQNPWTCTFGLDSVQEQGWWKFSLWETLAWICEAVMQPQWFTSFCDK